MPFPAVHPALDRALSARGYAEPTPVQLAVVEADQNPDRPNADMLVSAQTGSGKTVAFGLAMASNLLGDAARFERASKPLALVIAPTRELAIQIGREFEWLYADTGAKIVQCVGGMSVRGEQGQLERGAHIIIGTPGRLNDHLAKGYLDLSDLRVAVLDEADEMLDLGFREELETLLTATPESRRTLLFSATIARGIAMLAKNYQRDALRIDTTSATQPHGDIDYRAIRIMPGDIERAVVNVLRFYDPERALVFCHTREAVRHLHAALRERGFHAVSLSGEMGQRERNEALQSLRDGHAKVCVATDVAARGLDLPNLSLVIHADLPTNKATLLHRSGRTGRAGKKGASVLLVPHIKRRRTETVLQSANIERHMGRPAQRRRNPRAGSPAPAATSRAHRDHRRRRPEARAPDGRASHRRTTRRRTDRPAPRTTCPSRKTSPTTHACATRRAASRVNARSRGRATERGFVESEGDGVWFRLNVGRSSKADPKWILPLICRLGQVTKAEIGPIRIFDDETKFEIVGHAAAAFADAVKLTSDEEVQIEPSSAPRAGETTHPMRAKRDGFRADRAPREDRPQRDFGDRPPREKRDYSDRPAREPRADARPPREDFKRSGRDDARAARYQQRDNERAKLAADPVYSSLGTPETAGPSGPPPKHPSGLNRKERRDAARAEGKIAPLGTETPNRSETPKRKWTPDAERAPRGDRPERRPRAEGARSEYAKPEGFKPRGPKPAGGAKPFKARGDKPFKARGDKPFGKPSGDKPFRGKPGKSFTKRGER